MISCVFCDLLGAEHQGERLVAGNRHAAALRDGFPVSEGHTLIVPQRHVQSVFELAGEFKNALVWLMSVEKKCSGDAYFHYLSAQCHAALGNMDAARKALKQASAMSETLRMRAMDEPVFEAIFGAEPLTD